MKTRILLMFAFIPLFIKAQVNFTIQLPPNGILLKDQLWNVVVTNNQNDVAELRLEIDVKDVLSGESVFNATSGKILIAKGMKVLSVKDMQPIMYNYIATELAGGYLPCGTYSARYHFSKLTGENYETIGDEILNLSIAPLSPPSLTMPVDKSVLQTVYPQFSWMPPAPMQMFNPLVYDLKVVTVDSGQSKLDAIEFNTPVYMNSNLQNPMEQMPATYEKLALGKTYAWRVVARNGYTCAATSEIWEFKTNSPTEKTSVLEQTPFTKMKKENPDKGYAPGGILKTSYINETTERSVFIEIIDPGKQAKEVPKFKVAVKPGENLIQYDLNKVLSLEKEKIYEARIVNERNEKWLVQFEVY